MFCADGPGGGDPRNGTSGGGDEDTEDEEKTEYQKQFLALYPFASIDFFITESRSNGHNLLNKE